MTNSYEAVLSLVTMYRSYSMWPIFRRILRQLLKKHLFLSGTVSPLFSRNISNFKKLVRKARSGPSSITEKMKRCLFLLLFYWYMFNFRFIEAKADRVTVIFSTLFKDPDDIVIGKLFLQVFFFK